MPSEDPASSRQKVTWENTVRHFFTKMDVDCMKGVVMLNDHASVKAHAHQILSQVSSGNMPPAHSGEQPWQRDRIRQFEEWIAGGCL